MSTDELTICFTPAFRKHPCNQPSITHTGSTSHDDPRLQPKKQKSKKNPKIQKSIIKKAPMVGSVNADNAPQIPFDGTCITRQERDTTLWVAGSGHLHCTVPYEYSTLLYSTLLYSMPPRCMCSSFHTHAVARCSWWHPILPYCTVHTLLDGSYRNLQLNTPRSIRYMRCGGSEDKL